MRARRRTVSGWAAAALILLFLAIVVGGLALSGWIVMLLAGGLHHMVAPDIPALAYGPSVLIAAALSFVSSFFRSTETRR
jgi:hypothetical protein